MEPQIKRPKTEKTLNPSKDNNSEVKSKDGGIENRLGQKITIPSWKQKLQVGGRGPSPGNIQSCRISLLKAPTVLENQKHLSMVVSVHESIYSVEATLEEAKDDKLQPLLSVKESLLPIPHKEEVQNLVVSTEQGSSRLGSIDASGVAFISIYDGNSMKSSYQLNPQPNPTRKCDYGWCGLDINPSNHSQVATAKLFDKSITIYDADKPIHRFMTANVPTQIQYVPLDSVSNGLSPLLCITEYNDLSLWDLRSNTCVKRLLVSPSALYALDAKADFIGVAGASRCVHIFDSRKWTAFGTWSSCLKYEATCFKFATSKPNMCFVGGLDSELSCGLWSGKHGGRKITTTLGDSRWLGLHKAKDSDLFIGFTETNSLYIYDFNSINETVISSNNNHSKPAKSKQMDTGNK